MIKKDILFIWIPKTAGTSMYHVFKKYGCFKLKYHSHYKHFKNRGFVTFDHVNVFKLIDNRYVSREFFNDAFKFAFVRNPWDRLVSFYFSRKIFNIKQFKKFEDFCIYLEKKIGNKENFLVKNLNSLYDKFFHKFYIFHKKNLFHRFNNNIAPVGLYNVMGFNQINSQLDWITDEYGNLIVDFIGRFENLESDFDKLSEIIGIKEKLPILRTSDHKNYRFYYNQKTQKIVEKIYSDEIKFLNYHF